MLLSSPAHLPRGLTSDVTSDASTPQYGRTTSRTSSLHAATTRPTRIQAPSSSDKTRPSLRVSARVLMQLADQRVPYELEKVQSMRFVSRTQTKSAAEVFAALQAAAEEGTAEESMMEGSSALVAPVATATVEDTFEDNEIDGDTAEGGEESNEVQESNGEEAAEGQDEETTTTTTTTTATATTADVVDSDAAQCTPANTGRSGTTKASAGPGTSRFGFKKKGDERPGASQIARPVSRLQAPTRMRSKIGGPRKGKAPAPAARAPSDEGQSMKENVPASNLKAREPYGSFVQMDMTKKGGAVANTPDVVRTKKSEWSPIDKKVLSLDDQSLVCTKKQR